MCWYLNSLTADADIGTIAGTRHPLGGNRVPDLVHVRRDEI
jgi:hypothetical protein